MTVPRLCRPSYLFHAGQQIHQNFHSSPATTKYQNQKHKEAPYRYDWYTTGKTRSLDLSDVWRSRCTYWCDLMFESFKVASLGCAVGFLPHHIIIKMYILMWFNVWIIQGSIAGLCGWFLASSHHHQDVHTVYKSDLPRTVCAQKVCVAIATKFMSTPQTTTSGQHLWSIALSGLASKYSYIPNVLEKMLGCAANRTYIQ